MEAFSGEPSNVSSRLAMSLGIRSLPVADTRRVWLNQDRKEQVFKSGLTGSGGMRGKAACGADLAWFKISVTLIRAAGSSEDWCCTLITPSSGTAGTRKLPGHLIEAQPPMSSWPVRLLSLHEHSLFAHPVTSSISDGQQLQQRAPDKENPHTKNATRTVGNERFMPRSSLLMKKMGAVY